jgi:hypothetical protein
MPRLRMRGAIPPLPQEVFMAWCLTSMRYVFMALVGRGKGKVPVLLTEHHAMKAYLGVEV